MATVQENIEKWKKRKYSWSQHSSFRNYDKEEWYSKYILDTPIPTNKRMTFGSLVGKRIESDPKYIPQLMRGGVMEYGVTASMRDFEIVGYMDQYFTEQKHIDEYKTSGEGGWSQDKVDKHNQLDFYCLLLMLKENIMPEDVTIFLHHLVTEEGQDFSIKFKSPFTINSYHTKRTTMQVLEFAAEITKVRKDMEDYIINYDKTKSN